MPGMAAILLSALMYAYNLILQRRQALLAGPIEIAFFQSATVVLVYLCFSPWWAVTPPVEQIPQLAGAAILGIIWILMLSWAYARAQAKVLIPVEYTAFVWAALLGWLVFSESLTLATLAGTALIVTGCMVAVRQQPERVAHVETTAV
jgi:S-adenosylmethionine uptake transporter